MDFLNKDRSEQTTLVQEFLIGVTKFFRDPALFDIFEREVVAKVIQDAYKNSTDVKAWVVGCSTGEEAYSIAMAMEDYMIQADMPISYKIFATDVDTNAIDIASKGIYNEVIRGDVSEERLNKYFIPKQNNFQIKSELRKNIIFSSHDILRNPPFNKMDFVSCRNMLIYFNNEAQQKALNSMHFALKLNGYLFLGPSERMGILSESFKSINKRAKIYKNIVKASSLYRNLNKTTLISPLIGGNRRRASIQERVSPFVNDILLEATGATCVLINARGEIIHAFGNLKQYISIPNTGFSNNILDLLPSELVIAVGAGMRTLNQEQKGIFQITKKLNTVIDKELINIQVRIDKGGKHIQNMHATFLITFIELNRRNIQVNEKQNENNQNSFLSENKSLKQALEDTRENLQLTIEELETSNEKIQATNEELIASNEELQSTNEELQSVNEELHTVNAELQEKNIELQESYADMDNLINSSRIGTMFLDRNFKLRKYTPSIQLQMPLEESDLGRNISNFSWSDKNLIKDAKNVLQNLQPIRKEIQNKSGQWFLEQILPYRTQDDMIKGVVVSFIDISDQKKATLELEKAIWKTNRITEVSPGIIYIYDLETQSNIYSSENIATIAGYNQEEIKLFGNELQARLFLEEDLPLIVEHHKAMQKLEDNKDKTLTYRIKHKDGGERWLKSIDKVYERNKQGQGIKIIGVAHDVTEEYNKQLELNELNNFLESIYSVLPSVVYVYDLRTAKNIFLSKSIYSILGYTDDEAQEMDTESVIAKELLHPNSFQEYNTHIKDLFNRNNNLSHKIELQVKHKNGQYVWMEAIEKIFQRDDNGNPTKAIGIGRDIQDLKMFQMGLKSELRLFEMLYQLSAFDHSNFIDNLEKILKELCVYFRADVGTIGKVIKDKYTIIAGRSKEGNPHTGFTVKLEDSVCSIVIEKKEKLIINDIDDYPDGDKIPVAVQKEIKSYIGAPIFVENKVFGVLCFWSNTKRVAAYTDAQIRMLETLSNWFSKIIERQLIQTELERAVEELKQSNNDLERFNYIASHDLKEPLNSILSVIELLKMEISEDNEYLYGLFKIFEDSTGRMKKLINDLLDYSLIEKDNFSREKIDLNKLMELILLDINSQIVKKGVRINYSKLPTIKGDPTQIKLLFQNLISNSIKYSRKKPEITISCAQKGQFWECRVKDNGIGIAQKDQKKIFELFKKLHTKDEFPGTGIGLANCKRIVEKSGGGIWVESSLGQGATFYFTLPI